VDETDAVEAMSRLAVPTSETSERLLVLAESDCEVRKGGGGKNKSGCLTRAPEEWIPLLVQANFRVTNDYHNTTRY